MQSMFRGNRSRIAHALRRGVVVGAAMSGLSAMPAW